MALGKLFGNLHLKESQIIANRVRQYFRSRKVIQRFDFESFYESKQTIAAYMDFYNNKRLNGSLKRKTPMQVWNEYYQTLSTAKQLSAQVSKDMSRVSECADTRLALDKAGDRADFDYRLMIENNSEKVLSSFDKSVQLIGG